MNSPIFVAPPSVKVPLLPPPQPPAAGESVELLRQLVELQKEQVALARHAAAAADTLARWRAFLARWQDEFPDVGHSAKEVLPALERAYLRLVTDLSDRLRGEDGDDLTDDFVLAEFLDRFGVRLSQLGQIISQLSPLADAAPAPPAPAAEPGTQAE